MIVVVDFGSQLAHLISRRLKDIGVEVTIVDPDEVVGVITQKQVKGIIFSGGPASVYEEGAPSISREVFDLGIPILGICYGWQLMAQMLGGKVENTAKEYGPETLAVKSEYFLTKNLPTTSIVIMSHGDTVVSLPKGFKVYGTTDRVDFALVGNQEKKWYGMQFHPEAEHTEYGTEILTNYLTVCEEVFVPRVIDSEAIIEVIKNEVGEKKVICAVSGGVDSTVAAYLIGKAIGKQLIPVYVESGLMRNEALGHVKEIFTKLVKADLVVVEAKTRFMKALKGVTEPEEKRRIIGKLYVDIFTKEAKKREGVAFLGQGTIYSDVIESQGSKRAAKIKSHHNVGGLPKNMKLKLIEPLRLLYKDEVRKLGRVVGLPDLFVMQLPFPGPGYAIRVRGEVTEERLAMEKAADEIVIEEVKGAGLWERVFQCFAVMSGAYSTAVEGDGRAFAEVVAIRAYESRDIMTSRWAHLPYELLERMASRIVNEVPNVSRVVYDVTNKPPATMEWE